MQKNYNYTLVEQADLLTQLLLAIRHVDKVHILAHDYGDSVAQELLARHNEGSLPFKLLSVCLTNGGRSFSSCENFFTSNANMARILSVDDIGMNSDRKVLWCDEV